MTRYLDDVGVKLDSPRSFSNKGKFPVLAHATNAELLRGNPVKTAHSRRSSYSTKNVMNTQHKRHIAWRMKNLATTAKGVAETASHHGVLFEEFIVGLVSEGHHVLCRFIAVIADDVNFHVFNEIVEWEAGERALLRVACQDFHLLHRFIVGTELEGD